MSLTPDDIKQIAHPARPDIKEEALAALVADLPTMLALVEQLQAVPLKP